MISVTLFILFIVFKKIVLSIFFNIFSKYIFSAAQGKDNLAEESPQIISLSKILDRKFQKAGELMIKYILKDI